MTDSDRCDPAQLQELAAETFLRQVIHYPSTDSTNSRGLELVAAEAPPEAPFLVYTERQTSGRGRGGNRWWSAEGGLTFSLVIDTQALGLRPESRPLVSLLTGVAILEAAQEELPRASFGLKWPNDVFLAGRKLAGILVEAPPAAPQALVVGIGLNVNNSFTAAPAELQETGIALSDVSGSTHDRFGLLRGLLLHLERNFDALARDDHRLLERWRPYCLLSRREVTVQAGPREVRGECLGIDAEGALLVQTAGGRERLFGGVVARW